MHVRTQAHSSGVALLVWGSETTVTHSCIFTSSSTIMYDREGHPMLSRHTAGHRKLERRLLFRQLQHHGARTWPSRVCVCSWAVQWPAHAIADAICVDSNKTLSLRFCMIFVLLSGSPHSGGIWPIVPRKWVSKEIGAISHLFSPFLAICCICTACCTSK